MKAAAVFSLALLCASSAALRAECACCAAPDKSATGQAGETESPKTYPLRGVTVAVLAEKSALLVKHEEIPGFMDAMTMLFKVDAATLAAAKKDQAITATLVKKSDGWWLQDVQSAVPAR